MGFSKEDKSAWDNSEVMLELEKYAKNISNNSSKEEEDTWEEEEFEEALEEFEKPNEELKELLENNDLKEQLQVAHDLSVINNLKKLSSYYAKKSKINIAYKIDQAVNELKDKFDKKISKMVNTKENKELIKSIANIEDIYETGRIGQLTPEQEKIIRELAKQRDAKIKPLKAKRDAILKDNVDKLNYEIELINKNYNNEIEKVFYYGQPGFNASQKQYNTSVYKNVDHQPSANDDFLKPVKK